MASRYVLIQAGDVLSGECTNLGFLIYDDADRLTDVFISPLRAKERGDVTADFDPQERIDHYFHAAPTLAALERYRDGMGHCMSYIWLRDPCGSLESAESLFCYVRDNWFSDERGIVHKHFA